MPCDGLVGAASTQVRLCIRTPELPLNAYAERFVRSIRQECLSRIILFGKGLLRRAIDKYLAHYSTERNHQGIGHELIDGEPSSRQGRVECSERLGGQLKHYRRAA